MTSGTHVRPMAKKTKKAKRRANGPYQVGPVDNHSVGGDSSRTSEESLELNSLASSTFPSSIYDHIVKSDIRSSRKNATNPNFIDIVKRKKMRLESYGDNIELPVPKVHQNDTSTSTAALPDHLKMAELLKTMIAGIESNDVDIIVKVMEERNEDIVTATLDKLSLEHVLPLIRLVKKSIRRKSVKTTGQLFWLTKLVECKLSYLMSTDEIEGYISPLLRSLNIRMEVFERILRLKGRLNLLVKKPLQIGESWKVSDAKPMVEFRDSDEEDEPETFGKYVKKSIEPHDKMDTDEDENNNDTGSHEDAD